MCSSDLLRVLAHRGRATLLDVEQDFTDDFRDLLIDRDRSPVGGFEVARHWQDPRPRGEWSARHNVRRSGPAVAQFETGRSRFLKELDDVAVGVPQVDPHHAEFVGVGCRYEGDPFVAEAPVLFVDVLDSEAEVGSTHLGVVGSLPGGLVLVESGIG